MTFFNIFSKKPIKKSPQLKITVDYREKNSLVISELMKLKFQIEFKQLPVADYLINNIAIERKTITDLIFSMMNKRLFSQLENMKQYENPLLILENYQDLDLSETKLNENAIRGLLLSISIDYKIPIIFSKDPKETATFISLLLKRKKSEISLRSKIQMSDSQRLQFILEGFPLIGPITAKKLLNKYKTIKATINAPKEEIKPFLGKKADKFLELLKKEYKPEK